MRSKSRQSILIGSGVLMIAMALGLITYNLIIQENAGESSQEALNSIKEVAVSTATSIPPAEAPEIETEPSLVDLPDYVLNPEKEMPEVEIDGIPYVGYLEIPVLELELPVISNSTSSNLRIAPCRNNGTPYAHNFVIGAHNYDTHFGRIKNLQIGDEVIFTDMDGNVFTYQVVESTILRPTQRAVLWNGEWPLSLFTCTIGGKSRVTVRCDLVEE